jgi:hypothetical protein
VGGDLLQNTHLFTQRGNLRHPSSSHLPRCLIVAYAWPCWYSCVDCSSVASSSVYSALHSLDIPFVNPWFPHSTLSDGNSWDHLFVSGPWSFVEPFWNVFAPFGRITAALDFPDVPPARVDGTWILSYHAAHGGVTDGYWWIGSSITGLSVPAPLQARRSLRHIFSPVHKGKPARCLPKLVNDTQPSGVLWETADYVSSFGLLPLTQLGVTCICSSVFGKDPMSSWVYRPLVFKELLQALDIPGDLGKTLTPCSSDFFQELPFTTTAPSKVLQPFLSNLLPRLALPPGDDLVEALRCTSPLPGPVEEQAEMEIWDIGAQMDADDGRQQAAKDDDVGIPYHLWDQPFWETLELLGRDRVFIKQAQSVVVGPQDTPLLGAFRNWLLRLWRRRVYLSLCRYLKEMTSTERDKSAGRDCLRRVTAADFWEWKEGSRLFFWRWLGRQRDWARDGLPIYQKGTLPSYRVKQGREPVASIRDAVANKLQRFIA